MKKLMLPMGVLACAVMVVGAGCTLFRGAVPAERANPTLPAVTNLADRVWVWGYLLDRTPSACPFVTVKTDWSLERAIGFLGAKRHAFYMNSMFNRDYIKENFPDWDEECFTNCIDTKLSDAHFEKLSVSDEIWVAI